MRTKPIPFEQRIKIVMDAYRKNYEAFVIPEPKSGETQAEFVSRCVSTIIEEYPQKQAAAICYQKWRDNM